MNLLQFLKRVDEEAINMSWEQLTFFLHDLARTLPENKRLEFLTKLNNVNSVNDSAAAAKAVSEAEKKNISELLTDLEQIKQDLTLIQNGELCLVGYLNEEYDDWYDSASDEFLFEDPKGVMEIIENACGMVHQCVDCELFQEGYELANILLTLEVSVEGDYSDYTAESMHLADLDREELNTYSFRRLVLDAMYAAYQSCPLGKKPEAIYRIILFWSLLNRWKSSNAIPEADQEKILNKLDEWIQMRVEGIMQNNRRNYYGECAAFIAALGEVKESRGERNARDSIFEAYRTKYSRRSAFHDEMRAFGMKDRRRK